MAVISGTNFAVPTNANGYVTADGFLGAPSTADINAQRLSTQAASFPNGLSSAGAASFPGGTTQAGTQIITPGIVTATGSNSQSGATLLASSVTIVVTVSATTRAVRIPATVNSYWDVFNDTATAVKVYPATNATISSSSTNTAVQIAAHKADTFFVRSATHVVSMVGA